MELASKLGRPTLAKQIVTVLCSGRAISADGDNALGCDNDDVVGRESGNFELDQHCVLCQVDVRAWRTM